MTASSIQSQEKLAAIFARINMSELPAMSAHVQELLELTGGAKSKNANYDDLARIILKDFSLTHKVLQFANSAYFALAQKVSTVTMAVAVIGFDPVRDLAIGIALLDDFLRAGINTGEISKLFGRSFLAALLARRLAETRYLRVLPEEAFICALMHDLGRIVACLYLPAMYQTVNEMTRRGVPEDEAARAVLDGLTYVDVGREVAIFWNMTDSVIRCMEPASPLAEEADDAGKYLHGIVDFSNRYVDSLLCRQNLAGLMDQYSAPLSVDEEEAVEMLAGAAQASAAIFNSIGPGMLDFDFRKRLAEIQALSAAEQVEPAKGMKEYWEQITQLTSDDFRLKEFFLLLLDALCQGLGFDRAVLAMVQNRGGLKLLAGRLGRGDISPEQVKKLQLVLTGSPSDLLGNSLAMGSDLVLAAGQGAILPQELRDLAEGRTVYLFPLRLGAKGVALLYLDRTGEKAELAEDVFSEIGKLRDYAATILAGLVKRPGSEIS